MKKSVLVLGKTQNHVLVQFHDLQAIGETENLGETRT